jgi:hypothetical protein
MLVIATPDQVGVRQMANIARTLNPEIEVVLRTHSEEEARMLQKENVGKVFMGDRSWRRYGRHVLGGWSARPMVEWGGHGKEHVREKHHEQIKSCWSQPIFPTMPARPSCGQPFTAEQGQSSNCCM